MAAKTPEERGYIPVEDAAKGLRQLADDIENSNKGRLAKISINVWYEVKVDPEAFSKSVELAAVNSLGNRRSA